MNRKITQLFELVQLLETLFTNYETHNPHPLLSTEHISSNYLYSSNEKDVQRLYQNLVHYVTCLNELHRIQIKGIYQSTREDNLTALNLLREETLTDAYLSKEQRSTYRMLMTYIGVHHPFTVKEANAIVCLPLRTIQRYFRLFCEENYLKRVGGNKKSGYTYELIDRLSIKNNIAISYPKEEGGSMFEQGMPEIQIQYPL